METTVQGKLIVLSAPSGAGKTTIMRYLLQQDLSLSFSISATTRQPRGTEVHGKDYYFFSVEDFRQKIADGAFVEYEEVYPGCFYGTLKSEVERLTSQGKHVVFDVDVVGGVNIKKMYGKRALTIFVQPPSIEALQQRLQTRATDTPEMIATRIAKAAYEMTFAQQFDVVIVNEDLPKAQQEAEQVIRNFLAQ
ncbi:MAG TPA: guanylate kinase [Paludibacteraceae bacterium]|nr:guanylate kinase [Paludibacteraceae bacterium]HPL94455.1 guanylate kinase [Paludibacteraceae bacterium]